MEDIDTRQIRVLNESNFMLFGDVSDTHPRASQAVNETLSVTRQMAN